MHKTTISSVRAHILKTTNLPELGEKNYGKVRDFYVTHGKRILITTDRQSAFDIVLGHIPYKGAVLNLLSQFWFGKTKHIVANHLLSVPHPNVSVVADCQPIPVEMVVRGYISGVTKTSIWYSYEKGEREIYGIKFPDGLNKNQKLPQPVITPTTHGVPGVHDERLTKEEIIKRRTVPKKLYEEMEEATLALFDFGSRWCFKKGLILVDTKYEFGLYKGKLMLIDEIHTPDSSRFWIAKTYKERLNQGLEPENFDKEFLRLWYAKRGYRGEGKPPAMPLDLILSLSQRYIKVYEMITGKKFKRYHYPIDADINKALESFMHKTGEPFGLSYHEVGDNYIQKDPVKVFALQKAMSTAKNLTREGFKEVGASRGESAYVFDMGAVYGACTQEGLGTKNLIADRMYKQNRSKTYYDAIAIDTVAAIVNDLAAVGAKPLVVNAHWAIGDNEWLSDEKRYKDLIKGWTLGCNLAGASYGGGETPTLQGIVNPDTIELSGSGFGVISPKSRLIVGEKLKKGDAIVFVESSGVHANGLSLVRKIASSLKNGYLTRLPNGQTLGEAVLTPSYVYAKFIERLFTNNIDIHYLVNITGHGWKKIMRANREFTYIIHTLPPCPEEFNFLKNEGPVTVEEMYSTFNMGAGLACFVPKAAVRKTILSAKKFGLKSWEAGFVEQGPRRVVIKPLGIEFDSLALKLR